MTIERERLRQVCLHALEALAERWLARGRHAQAIDAALGAVQGDPLRESARRTLIRIHVAEGNPAEALRQFHDYRALLHRQLGIDPSSKIQDLVRAATQP